MTLRKNSKILKEARKIIRSHGIRYRICWKTNICYAYSDKNFIFLGVDGVSVQYFISAVFHEIQHILNFRNGKYKAFHSLSHVRTEEDIKKIVRTVVKAEKYTDKYAKSALKCHFPDIKYKGYDKKAIKFLKEEYIPLLVEYLEEYIDK